MKKPILLAAFLILFATQVLAQKNVRGLPADATLLETRAVPSARHAHRLLVLWMIKPVKYPNTSAPDDIYTCPDQTRGSYYSGPTRVSLLDSSTNRIINTVIISEDDGAGASFDLPYAIRRGYYYYVAPRTRRGVEAKPNIMRLQDYNDDGKALEFALFNAEACMGLSTTLIGYSENQDRVIQYLVKLDVVEGSNRVTRISPWADYLFSRKPLRRGYWRYEIDYRGRGGSLDKWEVRYNRASDQFEGQLTVIPGD